MAYRRHVLSSAKKWFVAHTGRYQHIYQQFFRISAAGDKRISADGNTRITANSDY